MKPKKKKSKQCTPRPGNGRKPGALGKKGRKQTKSVRLPPALIERAAKSQQTLTALIEGALSAELDKRGL